MTTLEVPHWKESMSDMLDQIEAAGSGQRWPVLRRGKRAEIPQLTRALVLRRDNQRCKRCGWARQLHLDHVVPWSYFGSDRSWNLQTLCEDCNLDRSNFREAGWPWPRRIIGVTAVCDPCVCAHDMAMAHLHEESGLWFECPACRDWGGPWEADKRVPSYCGTCDWTSWVSDLRRIL